MYSLPEIKQPARVKPGEAILVASGDLRLCRQSDLLGSAVRNGTQGDRGFCA